MIFGLNNLSAGYGNNTVLRNIFLEIAEGDFISIIGPNGSGKSTLLLTLAGELPLSDGTIVFKNKFLHEYDRGAIAREISLVRQFRESVQPFTVHEFVRLGRFPMQRLFEIETKTDRMKIARALACTGLEGLGDRILTELSGGELQLAYIANCLARDAGVILLDEPVTHLDINHAVRVMDILYELNSRGKTVIATLHDINLASDYSKRIIGLGEGRIFFSGMPEDVLKYDLIEELFGAVCTVTRNPISGKPFVYTVPGYIRKKRVE